VPGRFFREVADTLVQTHGRFRTHEEEKNTEPTEAERKTVEVPHRFAAGYQVSNQGRHHSAPDGVTQHFGIYESVRPNPGPKEREEKTQSDPDECEDGIASLLWRQFWLRVGHQ
jgi:hypothetical protein